MTHYYSPVQESKFVKHRVWGMLRGHNIEIDSASGIFSAKRIDKATELLVNNAIVEDGWKVLDLGCGCGVVGIAIALDCPSCSVVMSDVNKRAVRVSKDNVLAKKLDNIKVVESDVFSKIKEEFDTIITNPPMVAGRQLCFRIVSESKEHLIPGGLLQLVARHSKGGEQLSLKMEEVFGNVKEVAKKGGFRVYVSKKD